MSNDCGLLDLLLPSSYMDTLVHYKSTPTMYLSLLLATSATFYLLPHSFTFIWINLAARRIHTQYIAYHG